MSASRTARPRCSASSCIAEASAGTAACCFSRSAAGSGGDSLEMVEFVPGTATLTEASTATLGKVATALLDRPSLLLTAAGSADPQAERLPYQRATLDAKLARDKPGTPALAAAERDKLQAASPADDAAMTFQMLFCSFTSGPRVVSQCRRKTAVASAPH